MTKEKVHNIKLLTAVVFIVFLQTDHDHLFYIIHEKVSVPPKAILPHLWTYRSRITLEHLFQTLQTKKGTCPILHEFLQQVS